MAADLQLLGAWPSPYVGRVRIALGLKGIDYEFLEQDLRNKSELLLNSNPVHKKIPVLLHAGRPICESLVILQYIDEAFAGTGPSILPTDPYDRSTARFWAAYVDDKALPAMRGLLSADSAEKKAAVLAESAGVLKVLEEGFKKCSGGRDYFGGDEIGYVDIALGASLAWMQVFEKMAGISFFGVAETPLLAEWADRFRAHKAVSPVLPPVDKLAEFAARLQQAAAAAPSPAKN